MDLRKLRLLLWSGCLAGIVLFAGDMLFYGTWGSGRSFTTHRVGEVMAHAAPWRLHLGAISGPIGMSLALLGNFGLWLCCRHAAPRLAALMLVSLCSQSLFGVLQQGLFAPLGFVLRHGESTSEVVAQLATLNTLLMFIELGLALVGVGIWSYLTLRRKAQVPRWTIFLCPLFTIWLAAAVVYLPAPLGYALAGGFTNVAILIWFAVVASTCRAREAASP